MTGVGGKDPEELRLPSLVCRQRQLSATKELKISWVVRKEGTSEQFKIEEL